VQTGRVDLGGDATLHWWMSGTGRPLLLVHPSGADHTVWDPLLPALPADRTVISYDLRGHGCSPAGRGDHRHAEDLLTLLDALDLDRVDAAGASYGGQVVVEAAALVPARIGAVALLGPSMPGYAWSDHVLAAAGAQQAALEAGDVDEAVRVWMDTWVRGPHRDWAELDPSVRDRLDPAVRRSFAAGDDAERGPGPDWAAALAANPRPSMVLVGDRDLADCRAIAGQLAGLLGVEPVVLPGVGHLLGLEQPTTVGRLLAGFFSAD
jgi:pimeloyl-ACP methyl ester carboxylesterase